MSQESNNNSNGWLWLAVPFAGVLAWRLFRNTANQANRVTDELDATNAQAVKLYGFFGITKVGGFAVATPIILDSTLAQVGWLIRNVCDWPQLQRTFTQMCGGNYTVLQAASTALSSSEYAGFTRLLETALTQKRIFANADYHTLYNANRYGGSVGENYREGQFVGRCVAEDDLYYKYLSQKDGVYYYAEKEYFSLMD